MSNTLSRPYSSSDKDQVLDLLLSYRLATSIRTYPTIWRFRLLLTSRVWEPEHDVRIWEAKPGMIVGFAMLWRRRREDTNLVLDHFVRPGWDREELISAIIRWGVKRGHKIANEKGMPLKLFSGELDLDVYSKIDFAAYGFSSVSVDPQRHNVYLMRLLSNAIPAANLPEGYIIRSPKGVDEYTEYERLYGFAGVSAGHRQEILDSGEYDHLVVVDQAGRFLAYCEHSISRMEWDRGAERVGWIDYIGTQEEAQGKGLGESILLAALGRLRDLGADSAMLVTISDNVAAMKLYAKVGFIPVDISEPRRYKMEILVEKDE